MTYPIHKTNTKNFLGFWVSFKVSFRVSFTDRNIEEEKETYQLALSLAWGLL